VVLVGLLFSIAEEIIKTLGTRWFGSNNFASNYVDAAEQKMQQDQKIDRFSLQKMHIFLY
jgi:hypothetical protein